MVSTSLTEPSSQPHMAHFKEEKAGVQRERRALANTPCPAEIRVPSQPQDPAPTYINVLRMSNGTLKGSVQSGFWRIWVILTWLFKTVWLELERIMSSATELDLA